MTLTTYYHATPYENLHSIMGEGIRRSWGGVYCSTVMETSAKWICFTRPQSKKIVVLPFKRLKSQMDYASFVCAEGIPASDIVWEDVRVFENPFFAGVEQ